MNPVRLLIVDDHAIVRTGLVALLESDGTIEVVGEAGDGRAAVRLAGRLHPDVVLMDIMMPEMDGIAATREIKARLPDTKVLILTTSTLSDDLAAALDAGADGAVTKATTNKTLLATVKRVAAGEQVIAPEISRIIANDPPVKALTERQRCILKALTEGKTNKEIAEALDIHVDGVRQHLIVIFKKLGAVNRAEAASIALRKQLLK